MGWPATSNRGYGNRSVNLCPAHIHMDDQMRCRYIPWAHRGTMGGTECLLRGLRPVDKVSVIVYRDDSVTHQDHGLGGSLSIVIITHWYIKHDGMQRDVKIRITRTQKARETPKLPKNAKTTLSVGHLTTFYSFRSHTFSMSRWFMELM